MQGYSTNFVSLCRFQARRWPRLAISQEHCNRLCAGMAFRVQRKLSEGTLIDLFTLAARLKIWVLDDINQARQSP